MRPVMRVGLGIVITYVFSSSKFCKDAQINKPFTYAITILPRQSQPNNSTTIKIFILVLVLYIWNNIGLCCPVKSKVHRIVSEIND